MIKLVFYRGLPNRIIAQKEAEKCLRTYPIYLSNTKNRRRRNGEAMYLEIINRITKTWLGKEKVKQERSLDNQE